MPGDIVNSVRAPCRELLFASVLAACGPSDADADADAGQSSGTGSVESSEATSAAVDTGDATTGGSGVLPSDSSSGESSDEECIVGNLDCACTPDASCDPGLQCMDFPRECGPMVCVDEPSRLTTVTLDEGGRVTELNVAWFDYWACSLFAGLVFKPVGAEFDGNAPPPGGRMFVVDESLDWSTVAPGQMSPVSHVNADGTRLNSGDLEVMEIERTPVGRPIAVIGTISAGTADWSLEGTFRATRCGNGWGPGFPCE